MVQKTSCELEDCRWILGVSEDLILLLRMSESDGETETEVHMCFSTFAQIYIFLIKNTGVFRISLLK